MCLILFAVACHPRYRLVLAANRDEFYQRPTEAAMFWNDFPNVLAGRDLLSSGTWLGISKTGRLAAVTNFRDPNQSTGEKSRGFLVSNFLSNTHPIAEYLSQIQSQKDEYAGFNLLTADFSRSNEIFYFSNREDAVKAINPGVYGLSNHLLDTPWPKVLKGKSKLQKTLENEELSVDSIFEMLADRTIAEVKDLPDTGIGKEREKVLSPAFIEASDYGTRCSTVILIDNDNQVKFIEKSFKPDVGEATFEFQLTF
jgi:uncharacterized protein with NRDE domain